MEDVDITATNTVTTVEEDVKHKTTGIGTEAMVVEPAVISHVTVGHTYCVPIRAKAAGPQHMANKRTYYGVTRCWLVSETAPDRLGQYLLIKLM